MEAGVTVGEVGEVAAVAAVVAVGAGGGAAAGAGRGGGRGRSGKRSGSYIGGRGGGGLGDGRGDGSAGGGGSGDGATESGVDPLTAPLGTRPTRLTRSSPPAQRPAGLSWTCLPYIGRFRQQRRGGCASRGVTGVPLGVWRVAPPPPTPGGEPVRHPVLAAAATLAFGCAPFVETGRRRGVCMCSLKGCYMPWRRRALETSLRRRGSTHRRLGHHHPPARRRQPRRGLLPSEVVAKMAALRLASVRGREAERAEVDALTMAIAAQVEMEEWGWGWERGAGGSSSDGRGRDRSVVSVRQWGTFRARDALVELVASELSTLAGPVAVPSGEGTPKGGFHVARPVCIVRF